jgi:hypothetical protein
VYDLSLTVRPRGSAFPRSFLLASSLSNDQLLRLAQHGAQTRIAELRDEINLIEQAFPDMQRRRRGRPRKQKAAASSSADAAQQSASPDKQRSSKSGRRRWTAAQRKAAGERMKAYWAKRKK